MNLITTIYAAQATGKPPKTVIAVLRDERGIVGCGYNAGQLALARWLLSDTGQVAGIGFAIGEQTLIRVLTGEIVPDDALAVRLATWSDGAVSPDLFVLDETPAADDSPAAGRAADHKPIPDRSPAPVTTARIGDEMTLSRGPTGVMLSGADWAVQFDAAFLAELHAASGVLLATPAA